MNEEPMSFTTLNKSYKQKHMRKNDINNKDRSNELPGIKKEVKHHKQYKKQETKAEDIASKGDPSHLPWKLISAVLGVKFLLLLIGTIVVAIFTTNSSSKTPFPTTLQEGPHCQPCPEDWVWFRCSCYYFSKKKLTWRESQHTCWSLNSSLVKINREEMNFFSLKSFFWTGIYYEKSENQWLWENNSVIPSHIAKTLNLDHKDVRPDLQKACLSYMSGETHLMEPCEICQNYICKKHSIYPMKSQWEKK